MNYDILPLDYKKTFSRHTSLLKFIGVDFFNDPGVSTNSKVRLFVFNFFFISFVCSHFVTIANITPDTYLENAQAVPVSVILGLNSVKIITALVNKSEIKEIFLKTAELWPKGLRDDDEKSVIMKNWIRRMGTPINAFYICAIVHVTVFEVRPLLTTCYNFYTGVDEYVFPFTFNLVEVNSTRVYVAAYVWEVTATAAGQLNLYVPYDLLIVTMTSNISILFRLLQVNLENSIKTHDEEGKLKEDLSISDPESYERLLRIVKDHQKLLRIANQLSNIFGPVLFTHVVFAAVLICFFGFLTVVYSGVVESIANLLTMFTGVITILLLALSGQLLCDTSSSVADAAYQSLWYESDKKVKKIVVLVIIRSQRPCYLSALGFTDMTLRSFSKIMSTAWTYFSLLVQMYK